MGWPAPSPIFKARRESATEDALAKIEGSEFLNVLLGLTLGHHTAVDMVETGKTPFEKSVSDRSFETSEAKYFAVLSAHEKFLFPPVVETGSLGIRRSRRQLLGLFPKDCLKSSG